MFEFCRSMKYSVLDSVWVRLLSWNCLEASLSSWFLLLEVLTSKSKSWIWCDDHIPVLTTSIADLIDVWVHVANVPRYSPYALLRFSNYSYVIPSIHIVGCAVKFWSWIVSWWSIMCQFSLAGIWINFILKFSNSLSICNVLASWNFNDVAPSISTSARPFFPWFYSLTNILFIVFIPFEYSLRYRISLLKLSSHIIFARFIFVSNTEDFYEASSTMWSNVP
jgi:hypothetical protein